MEKRAYDHSLKHLNIGAIGHVDHGKTTLLAAVIRIVEGLYGWTSHQVYPEDGEIKLHNLDAIPEEKKRGMTILPRVIGLTLGDMDFAWINLPGHEDYLTNSVRGMSCLDYGILVVGADDGMMPQTREHLIIASHLNIPLFIFLNKIDAVDDSDIIELIKLEIEEFCNKMNIGIVGNILEGSALKAGLCGCGQCKNCLPVTNLIDRVINLTVPSRKMLEAPVFSVLHTFPLKGRGRVIQGLIKSGQINTGDHMELVGFGSPRSTRVVELELIYRTTDFATAGQIATAVVADVENTGRGKILCRKNTLAMFVPQQGFQAEIELFKTEMGGRRSQIFEGFEAVVMTDTAQFSARVREIGSVKEEAVSLSPGETESITFSLAGKTSPVLLKNQPILLRQKNIIGKGRVTDIF